MKKLAVDLGNAIIKTSEEIQFASKFSLDSNLYSSDKKVLKLNGETYYIGVGEFGTVENSKAKNENLLKYLYSAIALSTDESVIDLALGLPIAQFKLKAEREHLKQTILNNKVVEFYFNNKYRKIIIDRINIFPEGVAAYAILKEEFKKVIIIDIGGKTTDIVYMSPNPSEPRSLNYGTLDIYNLIKKALEAKFTDIRLNLEDIQDIMENGFYYSNDLTGELEKQDIRFAINTTSEIFKKIYNELQLSNYPIKITPVILIGGGSNILGKVLKSKIKHLQIENDIFLNAKGFLKMLEAR